MLKVIHNAILTLLFSEWEPHFADSDVITIDGAKATGWVNSRWNGSEWEYERLSDEEQLDAGYSHAFRG